MCIEATNRITLAGRISSKPELSHRVYNEEFYKFDICIGRLSGSCDVLKCIAPARLVCFLSEGDFCEISGQIRSYNRTVEGGCRLEIKVFVREIVPCGEENTNDAMLDGFICKEPIYRVTPFGREIADMLIAVNRAYCRSDYIPVIAWGKNARICRALDIGTRIRAAGRLQSREYEKTDGEITVTRTAYELSACAMEVVFEG